MGKKKVNTPTETPCETKQELATQGLLSATSIRGNWGHVYCNYLSNIVVYATGKHFGRVIPTEKALTGKLEKVSNGYLIKGSIYDILEQGDKNNNRAYEKLDEITERLPFIRWKDKKRGTYDVVQIVSSLHVDLTQKTYTIRVNPDFIDIINDISGGYIMINPILFKKFKNKRSQLLYEILQSNNEPITRPIDWLKKQLTIPDGYAPSDYQSKIFDPINNDLRQAGADFCIEYIPNFEVRVGKFGKAKLLSYTLSKIPLSEFNGTRLAAKSLLAEGGLKKSTIAIIRACGFTDVQIQRNSLIFLACTQCMTEDFFAQSLKNWNSIEGLKNPKGYVIQQLKKSFTSFTRINPTISNLYDYCLKKGVNPDLLPKIARPASEVEAPDTPQDKSADHTGADAPTCAPKLTLDELKALLIEKGMDGEEVRLFSKTIEKWLELEQGEIEAKINRWSSTYGRITIRQIEDEVERLKHK